MEEDEGMSRSPNQSDKLSSYQKILKNHDPRIHESCIVFWVQWVLCITIHLCLLIKRKFGKPLIWIGDCTARQPRVGFLNWRLEFWNWGTFLLTPLPLFCSPFQILSQDNRLWSNRLVIVEYYLFVLRLKALFLKLFHWTSTFKSKIGDYLAEICKRSEEMM